MEISQTSGPRVVNPKNLQKGEVCNYRFQTSCGGIAFKPESVGGSGLAAWNITYVEFEKEEDNYIRGPPSVRFATGDDDVHANMPSSQQKFIYNFYTYSQVKDLYFVVNEVDWHYHINLGRKGQYLVEQNGWKKFNNAFQTESDEEQKSKFEDWKFDLECKPRFVYITLTAIENNAALKLTARTDIIDGAFDQFKGVLFTSFVFLYMTFM